MLISSSSLRWFFVSVALLACLAPAQRLWAQDVMDQNEEIAANPIPWTAEQRSAFVNSYFERRGPGAEFTDETSMTFQMMLSSKLAAVTQRLDLTQDERQKLMMAGRGDIKRFGDLVDEQRRIIVATTALGGAADLHRYAAASSQILNAERIVILGDDSLFAKTLERIEARHQNRPVIRARGDRYRKAVESVAGFLQKELSLSAEQRLQVTEVIVERTAPLNRYGELESYAVLHRIAKMPDSWLRAILSEQQWRQLIRLSEIAITQEYRLVNEQYLNPPRKLAKQEGTRERLRTLNQMYSARFGVKP